MNYDKKGFLVPATLISREVRKVVFKSLLHRLLFPSHYPGLVGHPCERRKHDSRRKEYLLQHMTNHVYTTGETVANAPGIGESTTPLTNIPGKWFIRIKRIEHFGTTSADRKRLPAHNCNERFFHKVHKSRADV